MGSGRETWDLEVDLAVIGSGGAGLTAAIVACDRGARVAVLEKTAQVGGATAVSGGVLWIPGNHHMPDVGIDDSRAEAARYVERLADGRSSAELIDRFVTKAPEMLRYLEEHTPLRFSAMRRYPDYHPELDGGRPGGRSLDPGLFDTKRLGVWADRLRCSPTLGKMAMTITEATDWGVFSKPLSLPFKELGKRHADGLVGYGASLVGGLLQACLDRGIEPLLETPARELLTEGGRVIGLRAERDGTDVFVRARRGVLLASGGFEWSRELTAQFLAGPLTHPSSPPGNEGDGLRMAMALGADLGNMSEAWWCPSFAIPGERYDGAPLYRGDFAARAMPHSLLVNRKGVRFVNEAHNYCDMMRPFFDFDPVACERKNLPAWLVLDQSFRDKYMLLTLVPERRREGAPARPEPPPPEWLTRAGTLEELAGKVGIAAEGLVETVRRFNGFAAAGADPDFRRGESVYDHFYGDPEHLPNPNLGAIEKPPFYAVEVYPGALGTKGGARVNGDGQVLHVGGEPIEGLYAAGNVMAGVTGPGYPGAGSTIGVAMTWGYLAGMHAARPGDERR